MTTNRNAFRLVAGAGLVLAAVVVGVPLGAQAVAPAASPTASPVRTATSFPTVNPSVYPTLIGTAWAMETQTAGTPQPPRTDFTQIAQYAATQGAHIQTMVASTPRTTPVPSGSPVATPTPDPCLTPVAASAEWKTHTSKDGRLSFQAPSNWVVVERAPGPAGIAEVEVRNHEASCASFYATDPVIKETGFPLLRLRIFIPQRAPFSSIEEWRADRLKRNPTGTLRSTTVGGMPGYRYTSQIGGDTKEFAWFQSGGAFYWVEAAAVNSNLPLFERLVGSLLENK